MLRRIQWTTLILIQCVLISVAIFAAEEPEERTRRWCDGTGCTGRSRLFREPLAL